MTNLQAFFQGFGIFFGVFIGIVSGFAINFLIKYFESRGSKKQEIKNLVFELEINIEKIKGWLEETVKYRNAVNGDDILSYFGYFNFATAISVTANSLFTRGRLYEILSHKQISELQAMFNELSNTGENYFNNKIKQRVESLLAEEKDKRLEFFRSILKKNIIKDINFLEGKLNDHHKSLTEIVAYLKK